VRRGAHLWAREEATVAGSKTGLGTTVSDLRAREGEQTGYNCSVMILTLRRSFGSGLRGQRSDGAASGRGMEAAAAEEFSRLRVLGEGGGCSLGKT
jgi:hypothetical protein